MIDHPTFGNMNRRTSRIIQRARHGNVHRIETNNTTYLIYDEHLQEEIKDDEPFWEARHSYIGNYLPSSIPNSELKIRSNSTTLSFDIPRVLA